MTIKTEFQQTTDFQFHSRAMNLQFKARFEFCAVDQQKLITFSKKDSYQIFIIFVFPYFKFIIATIIILDLDH